MNPHDDFELNDFEHDDLEGRYEPPASLDGPGIRFHGHKRHQVPPHVWQAIRDAAQRVLDNYTRVGTPCGHAPSSAGENHCAVMICPHVTPHPSRAPGAAPDTVDAPRLSPGQRHRMRLFPEMNIACPWCKARRGRRCTSPAGRAYSPSHDARQRTWHSTPEHRKNELIDQED